MIVACLLPTFAQKQLLERCTMEDLSRLGFQVPQPPKQPANLEKMPAKQRMKAIQVWLNSAGGSAASWNTISRAAFSTSRRLNESAAASSLSQVRRE